MPDWFNHSGFFLPISIAFARFPHQMPAFLCGYSPFRAKVGILKSGVMVISDFLPT
jgi:hypothetical protein